MSSLWGGLYSPIESSPPKLMNLETMTLISKAARASENISWDLFYREYCEDYQSPYTDKEIENAKALILHVNERYGTNFTWDEDKSTQ